MSAKQTIVGLATYNSWRRGDETIEMPAPAEIGATIDDAVNLLRKYDEMERELAAEREKLDWVFQNCKVEANDYTTGNRDVYYVYDREDLGAAMKEETK